jgi:deoxyribonuclease-4
MTTRTSSLIGAHVPVAGGLSTAGLAYAREIGAEAVQVFVSNPRGWATSPVDPAQDEAFAAACQAEGIPAFIHAPYLINFGSPSAVTVERSAVSLRHRLSRGRAIGALGVVVHTGSAVSAEHRRTAMAQVRDGIRPLLEELERHGADRPQLLLEPTAGQGQSLCAAVEDLDPYFEALDWHPRLGVCLDTCHAFAAGHDLAAPGGMKATLDALVDVVGPGRLALIHANDSKEPVGSGKDRHEQIGLGHIGRDPFAELLAHPACEGVSLVIETPGGKDGHARDVTLLRELRDMQH